MILLGMLGAALAAAPLSASRCEGVLSTASGEQLGLSALGHAEWEARHRLLQVARIAAHHHGAAPVISGLLTTARPGPGLQAIAQGPARGVRTPGAELSVRSCAPVELPGGPVAARWPAADEAGLVLRADSVVAWEAARRRSCLDPHHEQVRTALFQHLTLPAELDLEERLQVAAAGLWSCLAEEAELKPATELPTGCRAEESGSCLRGLHAGRRTRDRTTRCTTSRGAVGYGESLEAAREAAWTAEAWVQARRALGEGMSEATEVASGRVRHTLAAILIDAHAGVAGEEVERRGLRCEQLQGEDLLLHWVPQRPDRLARCTEQLEVPVSVADADAASLAPAHERACETGRVPGALDRPGPQAVAWADQAACDAQCQTQVEVLGLKTRPLRIPGQIDRGRLPRALRSMHQAIRQRDAPTALLGLHPADRPELSFLYTRRPERFWTQLEAALQDPLFIELQGQWLLATR